MVGGSESPCGAATTNRQSSITDSSFSGLGRVGRGGGETASFWNGGTFVSDPVRLCFSGMSGGGMGFRLGTGIGAVFVFLSGGGNGVPGGGRGLPRPITSG